jgi:hypothetical protein
MRRSLHDDGSLASERIEPMDPAVGPDEPPLLRSYCSDPAPRLRAMPAAGGGTRFEFTEGPIGKTGAATCILGWIARAIFARRRRADDRYGEHIVHLSTPVEAAYHDLLVHRSLGFALQPTGHLYGALPGIPTYPAERERGELALPEPVLDLGASAVAATMPECARYARMIEFGAARMGHAVSDFYTYRLRIRYPTIPSLVLYRYELEEGG